VIARERLAILSFALVRTAFCAYRAATQSITSDEAFSYSDFISGKWSDIYRRYDANNHVLYSILAKLSIQVFHTSEFTLRLPSVLSGFFLMLGVYAVLANAKCSPLVRWITLMALGLHPLLLDFSVAARGYSLSLALLVWAIYFFLRQRDVSAGALLGLAISANLTILFPAAGLVLCPYVLHTGDVEKRIQGSLNLGFTAMGVFGLICYASLSKATTGNFYAGLPSPAGALLTLVAATVRGSERIGILGTYRMAVWIEYFFLPLLTLFFIAVSIRTFLRYPDRRPSLAPVTMLLTAIAGLVAAHYLAGLPYPVDRLGLYLSLLFGLAWAITVSGVKPLLVPRVSGVLAGVLIFQFLTQVQVRYFQVWDYDLPAKEVARRLQLETSGKPPESVKVGVTWYQAPALEFYRKYYGISALQPIHRYEQTPLEGFDYYVLHLRDDKTIRGRNIERLRPLFSEPVSSVLLAKEP